VPVCKRRRFSPRAVFFSWLAFLVRRCRIQVFFAWSFSFLVCLMMLLATGGNRAGTEGTRVLPSAAGESFLFTFVRFFSVLGRVLLAGCLLGFWFACAFFFLLGLAWLLSPLGACDVLLCADVPLVFCFCGALLSLHLAWFRVSSRLPWFQSAVVVSARAHPDSNFPQIHVGARCCVAASYCSGA
jgi:hypothetical protein